MSVDLKGLTALCLPGKEGCPKQGKNQASSFAIPAALVHVGDAFLKGNTSNCGVEVSAHSPFGEVSSSCSVFVQFTNLRIRAADIRVYENRESPQVVLVVDSTHQEALLFAVAAPTTPASDQPVMFAWHAMP